MTQEEYFALDEQAERPVEWIFGEAVTRHGRSPDHCRIAARLLALLNTAEHEALGSLLRLHVVATGEYFYPDVLVIDENAQWHETVADTLLTPLVLVEIPSPETERHDRQSKLTSYLEIPSLQDYLIVSQDRVLVHHYARSGQNDWVFSDYCGRRKTVVLNSLPISIPLQEIYRDLDVPEGLSSTLFADSQ